MKNFKLLLALVFVTATIVPTVQAQIEANVALTTDYVWRGFSQNSEDPALQGGFDYSHSSGFYAGVWGANVDFGPATTELDLYLGWSTEFDSGFSIDVGAIEYTYHGGEELVGTTVQLAPGISLTSFETVDSSDLNFTEYYVGVGYAGFGITYYAGDEGDDNIEVSYGYDFESGFSVGATYGDYDAYSYYTIGASTELAGIGIDLSYWDTDVDDDDTADGRVVLTISKSF